MAPSSGIIQPVQCVQCSRDLTAYHSVETDDGLLCTRCYDKQSPHDVYITRDGKLYTQSDHARRTDENRGWHAPVVLCD